MQDRVSRIDTQLPPKTRSGSTDDDPQSVIHAPSGFKNFQESKSSDTSPKTQRSVDTVVSPSTPEALSPPENKVMHPLALDERSLTRHQPKQSPVAPVNTDIPQLMDRSTPRAQTREELETDWKRKSRRASSLEGQYLKLFHTGVENLTKRGRHS